MCEKSHGAIGKPPCCGRLFGHRCEDDAKAWEAVQRDWEREQIDRAQDINLSQEEQP